MNVSTAHYTFSIVTVVTRKIGRENVKYIHINKRDIEKATEDFNYMHALFSFKTKASI